MIIEIISAIEKYPAVGDVFKVENYAYDSEKYTLLAQLDPVTLEVINDDIGLNAYKSSCVVKRG